MDSTSGNRNLSSDQPIDDIAANLMQTIHRRGRGFVLGLERDKDGVSSIEVKESPKLRDEWEPKSAYRAHKIEDTDSFIAYARKYGAPDGSLVFYNDQGATLTIDEGVERGQRETISMTFVESDDWRDWSKALSSGPLSHKTLLKFLMTHEHNLQDPTVLKAMQSMRLNSTVNLESEVKDDGQTVGILVKTNAGEEFKKFPKSFGITLPVLDQDAYGDKEAAPARPAIRLEITLPDDPKQGPTFSLICSVWSQIKKGRIKSEGAFIAEQLDGWTVIHGEHETVDRDLPSDNEE